MSRAGSEFASGRGHNVTVLPIPTDPKADGMQQAALPETDLAGPRRDEGSPSSPCGDKDALGSASGLRSPRPPDWTDRWLWPAALAVALLAHAGVLYGMTHGRDDGLAGGGGQQVDAISVTMVHSDVLEAREPDRPQPAPASAAASVDSTDGAPESTAAAAAEQVEEKKEQPDNQTEKPRDEPVREADEALEVPREVRHEQQKQAVAAPAAGGEAARSETASEAKASAPAAASPGAVREYARYVAQALAKTKPKGSGGHGTVRVKFMIAGDGRLTIVEVTQTSGSSKLDNLATGAVRQTRFLVPPAGMTSLQLTFEVPYHFR